MISLYMVAILRLSSQIQSTPGGQFARCNTSNELHTARVVDDKRDRFWRSTAGLVIQHNLFKVMSQRGFYTHFVFGCRARFASSFTYFGNSFCLWGLSEHAVIFFFSIYLFVLGLNCILRFLFCLQSLLAVERYHG